MSKQRRTKKLPRNKDGGKRFENPLILSMRVPLANFRTVLFPSNMFYTTTYPQIKLLSGAASAFAFRLQTNSAYDVDPVVGSTNSIGFSEIMAYYKRYRVHAYTYVIEVANQEAFAVICYIANSNFDPTTTATNYYNYSRNPYGQYKTIAGANGGPALHTFRQTLYIASVYGEPIQMSDQFYGTDSASPTNLTWLGMGCQSTTGANLTLGVTFNVTLEQHTEFYERKVLII